MADVEARIQARVFPRRIRIKDFFVDFDKHRCGHITGSQFHRALDMCQLELKAADIAALSARYAGTGGRAGSVNYVAFAAAIDSVFTVTGLETAPSKMFTTGFSAKAAPAPVLGALDRAVVDAGLARIREFVLTRKVLVRPFFQDYEANQNSVMIAQHVTSAQFAQCLAREGIPVSPKETELLCRVFDDRGDGTVNFNLFADAVDDTSCMVDPIAGPPRPAPKWGDALDPTGGPGAPVPSPASVVEPLIGNIASACRVHGIRMKDFFTDFDKLRSKAIPYKKFITGLTMALEKTNLQYLSPENLLGLAAYYKTDSVPDVSLSSTVDMRTSASYFHQFYVDWKAFCDQVGGVDDFAATTSRFATTGLTGATEATARAAMDKLKERIKVQGVLVKHFFQDFEANQNSVMIVNHVTMQQFKQCCARLGFDDIISSDEVEAIGWLFNDRGDQALINYRDFVLEVDPAPPSINPWKTCEQVSSEPERVAAPAAAAPLDVVANAALSKIQGVCMGQRIRIHEFFQDFDSLRTGVVTARQFTIALSMAFDGLDVGLSPKDIDALSTAYGSAQVPQVSLKSKVDLRSTATYYASNYVRWRDFADDVDRVFCTKGLELMPTITPAVGEARAAAATAAPTFELAEEAALGAVLGRIKSRVETHRIDIRQFFKDFEANQNSPMRIHHVTSIQFRQALARVGIEVSDKESALLIRNYQALNLDGPSSATFVNFRAFCDDMQPPEPHRNPWKSSS